MAMIPIIRIKKFCISHNVRQEKHIKRYFLRVHFACPAQKHFVKNMNLVWVQNCFFKIPIEFAMIYGMLKETKMNDFCKRMLSFI